MMAVIMFLFGMWFYKSEGKATKFLSGYNMKSADERKKYDENAMCKGKRAPSSSFGSVLQSSRLRPLNLSPSQIRTCGFPAYGSS